MLNLKQNRRKKGPVLPSLPMDAYLLYISMMKSPLNRFWRNEEKRKISPSCKSIFHLNRKVGKLQKAALLSQNKQNSSIWSSYMQSMMLSAQLWSQTTGFIQTLALFSEFWHLTFCTSVSSFVKWNDNDKIYQLHRVFWRHVVQFMQQTCIYCTIFFFLSFLAKTRSWLNLI